MKRIHPSRFVTMETMHDDPKPKPAAISEVIGEPAIVINGIPDVPTVTPTSIHLDATTDAGSNDDPCFGEWLEGRKVLKLFGDRYYSGEVVKYDSETNWYRVVYEDGDFEDLEWHELEDVLLPLDISIPLKALALQRYKCEKTTCKSGVSTPKKRRGRPPKNVVNTKKSLKLIEVSQMSELKGEKQVEVDFGSKRRQNITQTESTLQVCYSDKSASEPGKDVARSENYQNAEIMVNLSKPLEKPSATVSENERQSVQALSNAEATTQEASKRQRELQKQSGRTARAEKLKRIESLSPGTAMEQNRFPE